MKKILLMAIIFLITNISFSQDDSLLMNDYLSIKNALVKNDGESASENAKKFLIRFETHEFFKTKSSLIKKVKVISSTTNTEKQRGVFSEISVSLWNYMKNSKELEMVLYYQYCPMKDAYWISTEVTIKNPYYGSKMLSCGSVKETKK